jgi:hypothetical protein
VTVVKVPLDVAYAFAMGITLFPKYVRRQLKTSKAVLVPGRHETPVRSIPHHRTGYTITFFAVIKVKNQEEEDEDLP